MQPYCAQLGGMKRTLRILALAAILCAPGLVQAAGCFADYKAQRTQGGALELHYGVIELSQSACSDPRAAQSQVAARIAAGGWQLLRVMSTFDSSGLNGRKSNAGSYFLRY